MKRIILSLSLVVALASCHSSEKAEQGGVAEMSVTYENTIKGIVNKKCINCHRGYGAAGSLDLSTYASVKNATEKGSLLQRINDVYKPMPKAGLMSQKNRDLFQKWVDNNFAME